MGGTTSAATGSIPAAVLLASLPYAILSTTVLMGKHIDKLAWDAPAGTHTLPVMLGEARARTVTRGMFVAFYLSVVALVAARVLPLGTLLVNCVGGLLIGLALLAFERLPNEPMRLLVVTGMLGGFTTFSSFPGESLILLQCGELLLAAAHTLAHVIGALAFAAIGYRIAQAVLLA